MYGVCLTHHTAGLPAPMRSIKASIPIRHHSQVLDLGGWYDVTVDEG